MADTNFSLIDLKALSEPACKLIEAVKDATGILYEPTRVRRRAKAEVDAAVIKLEGEEKLQEVALRAAERVKSRELRRQQNIETVISGALQELPEAVSGEPVDEDWIAQIFDYCQDVRNDEMQSLWSRLLAGEVAKPRTYSLRTLHTVKLLRKEDADLFTHFCNYVWGDDTRNWLSHISTRDTSELLRNRGLSVVELLHLQTLGLIAADSTVPVPPEEPVTATYYGREYRFSVDGQLLSIMNNPQAQSVVYFQQLNLTVSLLTDTGKELAPICGAHADETYLKVLMESMPKTGIEMKEVNTGHT